MKTTHYFIDTSPLLEAKWTGIATVTRNLCKIFAQNDSATFFINGKIVSKEIVKLAVTTLPGAFYRSVVETCSAEWDSLSERLRDFEDKQSHFTAGIFPNLIGARYRRLFDARLLVCNDLSFYLTPEFHDAEKIRPYAEGFGKDLAAATHIVCISKATMDDVAIYFPEHVRKLSFSHLGCDEHSGESSFDLSVIKKKYFLSLFTIEPRKNVELIIEFINRNHDYLKRFDFCFIGKDGWGQPFGDLLRKKTPSSLLKHIHFLGYVDDALRNELIRNAAGLIVPSFFEGFGLPVIEAMRLGTPVLASRTSSHVELGLPDEQMFDPTSVLDFENCFEEFCNQSDDEMIATRALMRERSAVFSWENFHAKILEVLDDFPISKPQLAVRKGQHYGKKI